MLPLRFLLILLIFLSNFPGHAQQAAAVPLPSNGLGKISFSNSCSAAAQPALMKGIAQLHSFQYAAAESAFTEGLAVRSKMRHGFLGPGHVQLPPAVGWSGRKSP